MLAHHVGVAVTGDQLDEVLYQYFRAGFLFGAVLGACVGALTAFAIASVAW